MAKYTYAITIANVEPDSSLFEKPGTKSDILSAFDKVDWNSLVESQFNSDDCSSFHVDDDETDHSIVLFLDDNRETIQFSGLYTFPIIRKKWFGLVQQDDYDSLEIPDGLGVEDARLFIELFLNEKYDQLKPYTS